MAMTSNRSRKNKGILPPLIILAIAAGGLGYYHNKNLKTTNINTEAALATSTIGAGDIILSATGPGTLIPGREISIGFKNPGRVSEVLASLGDEVYAGQIVATQDGTTLALEYQLADANLAALSSPAAIAAAAQTLEDAKQSFATARNDLQYLIGPDMLLAEERVADAQGALDLANSTAQNDPSDDNKQKVADAEAALTKAWDAQTYVYYTYSSSYTLNTFTYPIRNDNGVTIRKDLIAPSDPEILAGRAAYDLARANLRDAQNYLEILIGDRTTAGVPPSSITPLTDARIALAQAQANLDATELKAPINGVITSINLNAGDIVGSSAIVTISDASQPYTIDTHLDEVDWDKARIGYEASVTFDLLPGNSYPGKIIRVYPELDNLSGTSLIHILIQLNANINNELPMGTTASVDVTGGRTLNAILVPTSALKEVGPGKYAVYVMRNGTPVEQEVEIGIQDILNAEVKSGLQTGDVVVTNPTDMSR